MLEKGQRYEVKIEDMSNEGQGVGRIGEMVVFIEGTIVDDIVSAEITKIKKSYAFARLVDIIKPSKDRIEPSCAHSYECGGCTLQAMSYEGQLKLKKKLVLDKLTRIGGLENPKVNDTIGMEDPLRYRNKAQFPVCAGDIITKKGGILVNAGNCAIGFYKSKSHDVVNCDECLIQSEPAEKLAKALREFMISDHITAYDEKTGKGLIRHLIVKTAFGTGEVMAILVINGKGVPNAEKLVYMMDDAISELEHDGLDGVEYSLESVVLNINKKKTSEIMGTECITIAGKPTILEMFGELQFEISPMSFYQINPVQMKRLYNTARSYANLTGEETVLDLYCGVGTIGLYCASKAKKVIGIESVKGAFQDANRNAVINGIINAEFICGKVEDELPKLLEQGVSPDVVILDPPRAGCDQRLLESVVNASPTRIVYVSCDPATLARDIKFLCNNGYEFVEAQPVDMFPWTGHVEVIIKMTKCGLGEKK